MAWTAANELHSKDVDTEHLLLGLLKETRRTHESDIFLVWGLAASLIEHRLRDEISANLEELLCNPPRAFSSLGSFYSKCDEGNEACKGRRAWYAGFGDWKRADLTGIAG